MLEEAFLESAELSGYLRRYSSNKDRRKLLYDILEMISLCKRDWRKYDAISTGEWKSAEEVQVFLEYQRHLSSQDVIDFDDILLLAYRILSERSAIAAIYHRTYRYLFVDEAQDLNSVQYAIVRTLGEKALSVLLVGDPNQAIYGFNGSSKRFMLEEFPKDFAAEKVELRENFRSSRAVIRAANALYPGSIGIENAALQGELEIVPCADEEAEAHWVAKKIAALLTAGTHEDVEGTITPSRIAVLARNRYVFAPLQEKLAQNGLEYHLKLPGGGSALESDFGRMFDLGIRVLVNPKNRLHFNELKWRLGVEALASPESDHSVELLDQICDSVPEANRTIAANLLAALKFLHADVNRFSNVIVDLEAAVKEWETDQDGQPEAKGLALSDLEFLRTVWSNYTRRTLKDARALAQFRNQMATGEIVPNVEGKGLTLATVHAVKGLEYDIVFIMGWVEGGFPDYRAVKAGGAALAEEKNDAFVAVTRSKRLLYLTWPQSKFMPWDRDSRATQRKSRFLESIENTLSHYRPAYEASFVAEDPPEPQKQNSPAP
jgi:DNA helicase-2/ATP-dependent DNA helicase PcrA